MGSTYPLESPMTQTASNDLDLLRSALCGTVTGPDDVGYEDARRLWNAAIDRRPAVVAQCLSSEDVAAALAFARGHRLEVSVRCGSHHVGGSAMAEDGLVIDLTAMNQVSVNAEARTARVGGGALLGDVDAAAQAHGLAVPAGVVSHTGVGGLTLGGGMGWLSRRFGLTIDNLIGAQVVTADGQIIRAAADENADLFWALRGGGGNFGVVTEFEFRLHEVDPMVQFAMLFWPLERGAEVLRLAGEIIPNLPREVNVIFGGLNAPDAPFVPPEYQFQPGYVFLVTGFGSGEAHAAALADMREALPPAFEFVTPMPFVALQQLIDEANAWGRYCYDKACYLEELSDGAIEAITEHLPQKNSPLSVVLFYRLDGAYSEVADDATAFSGQRSPRYAVFVVGVCPVPELLEPERVWVRGLWEALLPHAAGSGSYINGAADFADGGLRASYGDEKYERLAGIKATYDPENVFRHCANIPPAAVEATDVAAAGTVAPEPTAG